MPPADQSQRVSTNYNINTTNINTKTMNTTKKSKYILTLVYTIAGVEGSIMIPVQRMYSSCMKLAQLVCDNVYSPYNEINKKDVCIVRAQYSINNMY